MNNAELKQKFYHEYLELGKDKFYKALLFAAINKLMLMDKDLYKGTSPEIEYLEYNNKFVALYRRDYSNKDYLDIAKLFRKAAHKVYWLMLKKNLTQFNNKFLNAI